MTRLDEPRDAKWVLTWAGDRLGLTAPDGRVVFTDVSALDVLDPHELFDENRVVLRDPALGVGLEFRRRPAARVALRAAVEHALARDHDRRAELERWACEWVAAGPAAGVLGAAVYAGGCWAANQTADPPPWSWEWLYYAPLCVGFAALMLFALVAAVAGPLTCYRAVRWRLRIRRIERTRLSPAVKMAPELPRTQPQELYS